MEYLLWLLLAVPGLLASRFLYGIVYNLFLSPLKTYPGPFLWRVSKLPYIFSQTRGQLHNDVLKLHEQYGPVVRVSPSIIMSTETVAWKDAWSHRQGHHEWSKYFFATPANGVPGILSANRENHARFRRLLSHAFSAQGLREQEPKIKHYVDLLMDGLSKNSEDGPLNMVNWFNFTTFDLIGDLAFGESFGCVEHGKHHPWIEAIFGNLSSIIYFTAVRSLGLTPLLALLVPKRLNDFRIKNAEFCRDKIAKRLQKSAEQHDFWDRVMRDGVLDAEKASISHPNALSIKEMESNASSLVLAGSETTATLLSGTTFQLLANPAALEKVTHEIRSSFASEEEITIDSVNHLPYMIAALTETIRIYPAVPTFSGRVVPEGGDTLDGKHLPAGTSVQFLMYAAFNLPANFRRPHEFIPERWLKEGMEGEFKHDKREVFEPFSVGPRNCIGKNLAYAEMRVILARLLWRFDLSVPEGEGAGEAGAEWHGWVERQKTYILWEKPPLMVEVRERKV